MGRGIGVDAVVGVGVGAGGEVSSGAGSCAGVGADSGAAAGAGMLDAAPWTGAGVSGAASIGGFAVGSLLQAARASIIARQPRMVQATVGNAHR